MQKEFLLVAVWLLLAIQSGWSPNKVQADQVQPRPLISARQRAPEPVGGVFERFKGFALNNQDDVALVATVQGGQSLGGIFLSSAGQLATVMAIGNPTPVGGIKRPH